MCEMLIKFVRADDWIGLYVDGDLKEQGHSIDEFEVARILVESLPIENTIVAERYNWDWVEQGTLPQKYQDIQWINNE